MGRPDDAAASTRRIPDATVARLPVYLRCLYDVAEREPTISSERLASLAGVNAAKVRKDLSHLGSYGTRGVGYDVEYLVFQISRELGLSREWAVAIVGVGNLGQALAKYGGFSARGFRVVALLDADAAKVGTEVAGHAVTHVSELADVVADPGVDIAVIATPAEVAQDVADLLVEAGVRSILNFAPAVIHVPPEVTVRKVDLATELQILGFYRQRDELDDGVGEVPVGSRRRRRSEAGARA